MTVQEGRCAIAQATHSRCLLLQDRKKQGRLVLTRQLIGNNDEVTDLRLLGPPEAPTHFALATNSPAVRVFDIQTLNCTATLAGHTDTVLVMDALYTKGPPPGPSISLVSPWFGRPYKLTFLQHMIVFEVGKSSALMLAW